MGAGDHVIPTISLWQPRSSPRKSPRFGLQSLVVQPNRYPAGCAAADVTVFGGPAGARGQLAAPDDLRRAAGARLPV